MSKIRVRIHGRDKLRRLGAILGEPRLLLLSAARAGQIAAVRLVDEGFEAGEDPYGNDWFAPNDLHITNKMRVYEPATAGSWGFSIQSTDQKAVWHHQPRWRNNRFGRPSAPWHLPIRRQVPIEGLGMSRRWRSEISRDASAAVSATLKRLL